MAEDLRRLIFSDKEIQDTNVTTDPDDYDRDIQNDNKDVKHRRKLHGIITPAKRTAVVIGLNLLFFIMISYNRFSFIGR